jgi:hypothetical protein
MSVCDGSYFGDEAVIAPTNGDRNPDKRSHFAVVPMDTVVAILKRQIF